MGDSSHEGPYLTIASSSLHLPSILNTSFKKDDLDQIRKSRPKLREITQKLRYDPSLTDTDSFKYTISLPSCAGPLSPLMKLSIYMEWGSFLVTHYCESALRPSFANSNCGHIWILLAWPWTLYWWQRRTDLNCNLNCRELLKNNRLSKWMCLLEEKGEQAHKEERWK